MRELAGAKRCVEYLRKDLETELGPECGKAFIPESKVWSLGFRL